MEINEAKKYRDTAEKQILGILEDLIEKIGCDASIKYEHLALVRENTYSRKVTIDILI